MESPFPPGLGHDPARDQATTRQIPRNLELPEAAYRLNYDFPTDLPERPKDLNTTGKAIQVRVNQFKVIQWPQKKVYQFDILIGNGAEKRGLVKAAWMSKTVQNKLRELDDHWLWDGNKIAWCSVKPSRDEVRIDVDLDQERGKKPRIDKATGRVRENKIRVVIRATSEINMAVISGYLERKMQFDTTVLEAINFLDHAMRQYPSEFNTVIKRSFFARSCKRAPLDKGSVEAVKGVYASMRLCQPVGSNGTGTGLAVNVDVANGVFWSAQSLHQAARNFTIQFNEHLQYPAFGEQLRPVFDDRSQKWVMSKCFNELKKMVKLKFSVKYRGKDYEGKLFTISGFCFSQKFGKFGGDAKHVTFELSDKANPDAPPKTISIYDYFVKKYDIRLQFHYLPLVKTEKDGIFPMEVCSLAPDQRYLYKLDGNQTAAMIKFAVSRPVDRLQAISNGIGMLKWTEDPYLKHYGIKIDPNLTLTNARLLTPPEVQFNGSKVTPLYSGRWDLRGKKFLLGNPKALQSWGVCVINNCLDSETVKNFLKLFIQTYVNHGGRVSQKTPHIYHSPPGEDPQVAAEKVNRGAGSQGGGQPQILLFILPDHHSYRYERLKKNMECRFGYVSQMMQSVHVKKAQPQYCSNVCMKLNAKLGGTTSRLVGKDANTPIPFFAVPTMIIGADVSHPSPGSPQGSMAAMTMSMDKTACRYAATVQTNGQRVEMITTNNIKTMMMPLFAKWVEIVGQKSGPQHIYYFRDGVSEGQYSHVLEQEVADMKKCIGEKYGPQNAAKIKFTVTVASKRHRIRLFPREHDSAAGDKFFNPLPGVLVERDVTHPFEYDFYLNSHAALQGTSRPVHYHVILDEANVPPNKFHQMIYQHCYQYMRSTTPVSLYPAVYYAHLASNRARAHENESAEVGPRGGQKFTEMKNDGRIQAQQPGSESIPPPTEILPLIPLGMKAADENTRDQIQISMWYI